MDALLLILCGIGLVSSYVAMIRSDSRHEFYPDRLTCRHCGKDISDLILMDMKRCRGRA